MSRAGGGPLPNSPDRPARTGLGGAIAGEMFSSLRVADYRRLYFGNMGFQFNSWAQQLTFGWLMLLLGNSPFWLGVNGAMTGIAMTVMSPIGGAFACSSRRRRLSASMAALHCSTGSISFKSGTC